MADYEDEQGKLRSKYEGEPDDDFHIDVPKELPEVNPEVYKDVEPLLFRGFLHVPADINGISFVFKSLNHHEFEMLTLMVPQGEATRATVQKFYSLFLAYGVFMVDGVNILSDRERHIPKIVEAFDSMNDGVKGKIVRHLSEINRRANRAVTITESFALEVLSRLRWAQLKGVDLTSTAVTGLEGTQRLGLNWAQLTWRAMNHYEDLRETSEREWENAKFVASAMAGKGMNRVHSQDRRRRDKEREDRLERRDRILRFALLGEPMESENKGAPVMVARTVEELTTQLEKDLKGEKDWHDLVVEAHERRAQEARQQRAVQLQSLQQNFENAYGPHRLVGHTDLQGLTPEEVRFRIERRQQLMAQRVSAQQVHPELMDPKMAEFQDKWSSTSRNPAEVPLVPTSQRTTGTPFRFNPRR
jgi:hypothetical protein